MHWALILCQTPRGIKSREEVGSVQWRSVYLILERSGEAIIKVRTRCNFWTTVLLGRDGNSCEFTQQGPLGLLEDNATHCFGTSFVCSAGLVDNCLRISICTDHHSLTPLNIWEDQLIIDILEEREIVFYLWFFKSTDLLLNNWTLNNM